MRQDARMLAALLGRSMGLGEAWEVSRTWSGEVGGGPDEPRAGVARRRGHAVPCPECGGPRGARDARERTWRHPGVWQSGTHARCAVPRTDCPGHGAGTVPVPRGCGRARTSRPSSGPRCSRPACGAGPPGRRTGRPSGTTAGPGTCSGARSRRPGGSADHPGAGRVGHRRDQPPGGPHPHTHHARPRRRVCARRGGRRRLGTAPRTCGRT